MVGDVDVVSVGVVESDEFSDGVGSGGYPNEELTEQYGPIKTYSLVMTWLVQVVSVSCDEGGGGVMLVLFSVFLVFLERVLDERRKETDDDNGVVTNFSVLSY